MLLNFRLHFQEHWKSLLKKVNKTVALLRNFHNILPGSALLTIYKCFVRIHLDYGDIIYEQAFHQKIGGKVKHELQVASYEISMWSPYYHHILAAGKLGCVDLNKTYLEGTI